MMQKVRIRMQIVIDIPEDVYTRLFDNGMQDNEIAVDDVCKMARTLRLGTPLPKGHGRLIDKDKMITDLLTVDPRYKNLVDWCLRAVTAQPTIIETDKVGEDK